MSSKYEIEVKTLIGTKENADLLKSKIKNDGAVLVGNNKQLNHYFVLNDVELFKNNFLQYISADHRDDFNKILTSGKNFSIRTREVTSDGNEHSKVILVIKASIDEGSSSNAVSRIEFENEMQMSIDELDQALLNSGLEYQAKWSREREEYTLNDIVICIDKNAGYGFLAEFEKVTDDPEKVAEIKASLLHIMAKYGVEELSQDRLERMFAYYNQNWKDYYGTDEVFIIK
jgi:adenylate cyclase class IV